MGRRLWPVLLLTLSLAGGALCPAGSPFCPAARGDDDAQPSGKPAAAAEPDDAYELYQAFADTIDQVERNYVKKVDRRELMEAAIRGVLSKLDPYSNYISPEELGRFKVNVENQFGGIGIQIASDHDQIKVLSPIVGSPAYRAGIQSGDTIVEVEGKSTDGLAIDEVVRRLKGETGSSVTFTVVHPGSAKRETVTIKREIIHVETVLGDVRNEHDRWDFMLDRERRIGYVRITGFSRDTAQELKAALAELSKQGMAGLIIDLRNNPGGLLTSAIEISDMFVADGRIVSTKGRNTPERTWDAVREGTYEGFPIAILVNRFSASASEIFSACLQDHKRAVVIGERTWGKGSVQNVIDLEEGRAALKLTTASYRRPSGKNIHRFPDAKESDEWGVMPDDGYNLRLSDREMMEFGRYRRDRDILRRHSSKDDALTVASADAAGKTPADTASGKDASPPAEAKPEAKPAAETQPTPEAKPGSDAKPADAETPTPPGEAPDKPAAAASTEKPGSTEDTPFVDRQLRKALDFLSHEMARGK